MSGIKIVFEMSSRMAEQSIKRKKIEEKFRKAKIRNLFKTGALIKKIASRSMKRSKWKKLKPGIKRPRGTSTSFVHDYLEKRVLKSEKGKPPRTHAEKGEFSLKTIAYALDSQKRAVYVGPLGKADGFAKQIEEGGTIETRVPPKYRRRRKLKAVIRRKVAPRPFMKPALDTMKSEYRKIWEGAIK